MSATPPAFSFHRAFLSARRALRAARALALAHPSRENPNRRPRYHDQFLRVARLVESARAAVGAVVYGLRAAGARPAHQFGGRMHASAHEAAVEAANDLLWTFSPYCGGPHDDPHPADVYLDLERLLEQEHVAVVVRLGSAPSDPTPADPPAAGPRGLSQEHQDILTALLALAATGETRRVRRAVVVQHINRRRSVHDFAHKFADLRGWKLTDSRGGSNGGVWLTPAGRRRAEELARTDRS
jgi:hypothetical protein